MFKSKNKIKTGKIFELDEFTIDRIEDMARFLEHSESDIIKFPASPFD